MILRPITLLGFLAAAAAGLHLYQTKHEVALLDRELRGIARGIDEAKERTQALAAEWAWLNEPERLRGVAQRHLSLEPMQPTQFLRLNEAERKLPQVAGYAGPTALFAERQPATPAGPVTLALLPRVPDAVQVAQREATSPVPPPIVLPLAPPPAAPPPLAALPAAPPAIAPPRPELVRPELVRPELVRADPARSLPPVARPAPSPRPAPAPAQAARPVTEVAALAPIAAPRQAVTQVAAGPRIVDPPVTSLGSALGGGGRALLPPPVPFAPMPIANAAGYGAPR